MILGAVDDLNWINVWENKNKNNESLSVSPSHHRMSQAHLWQLESIESEVKADSHLSSQTWEGSLDSSGSWSQLLHSDTVVTFAPV